MSSTTVKRSKDFKSKIPVPVFKVNAFNEWKEKKAIGKNISSKPGTSSNISADHSSPLLRENCKTELVKSDSKKISKRNEVFKSQPISTQNLNKRSVKDCIGSKKPREKYFRFKENKPSNKTDKDILPELFKKPGKKIVRGETKKAKPLADVTHNSPLSTSNIRCIQADNKCVQNENNLYVSQNTPEKKNQEKFMTRRDFSAQKDIKFEGNEIYRQMILRERGLSPSIPGVKLSSVAVRNSLYTPGVKPEEEIMKYIEDIKGGKRKLQIEKKLPTPNNVKFHTLNKVRNSLYTPGVKPEEEIMKYIEAIKNKRMQKSALKSSQKKVTFNFNNEEFSPKVELSSEQKSFANSENKLVQINEPSSENAPSSPARNHSDTIDKEEKNCFNLSKLENLNEHSESTEPSNCHEHKTHLCSDEDSEMKILVEKHLNILRLGETNNLLIADCNKSPFCSSKKISSMSLYRDSNSKFMNEAFSSQNTVLRILSKCVDQCKQRTTKTKICTPRPVSFSSNSRLVHNYGTDFLEEKNLMNLSNLAPIYTPLVLKNIAKNSAESPDNLSPVKLKLDFEATENETPKKEISGKMQVSSVRNIVTTAKRLDNLADKECDVFLSDKNCTVVCGRYLRNPVALTLTEGDEMHFLPIRP